MMADEGQRLLGWLCSWGDAAASEHLMFLSAHMPGRARFVQLSWL